MGSGVLARLAAATFLYSLGFGLTLFYLPFIAYGLSDGNVFTAGLLVAVPALASMLAAIPVGRLIDRFGLRGVFYVGLLLLFAFSLYLPHMASVWAFTILFLVFGVSSQVINCSLKVFLFGISPKGKTSKYFAYIATAFPLGFALGPVLGGYLASEGLRSGLMAASALFASVLVLVGMIFHSISSGVGMAVKRHTGATFSSGSLTEYGKLGRAGVMVLLLTVLFTTYEGLVWMLEPLFKEFYGLDSLTAGLILSMFVIPFIIFNVPAGVLADRHGKMRYMVPGLLTAGVFIIIFGMVRDPLLLMASAFLSTVGLAFAWVSSSGLVADRSRELRMGGVVGVWNTSEELGYLIGPILGGLVADKVSVSMPFILVGAAMVLSALAYIGYNKAK